MVRTRCPPSRLAFRRVSEGEALGRFAGVPVVVLVVALAASLVAGCSPDAGEPTTVAGVVIDVIDGDTVEVDGVGRVRLVGVDTPEIGDCGYDEARDELADLVLGKSVELVPAGVDDRDRYDRLLRYVDVDGVDAGLLLIEEGLAVSRYDSRDGYGEHQREQEYVQADAGAVPERLCPTGR
jgi:endonuclease YncB( thermonuclease family)